MQECIPNNVSKWTTAIETAITSYSIVAQNGISHLEQSILLADKELIQKCTQNYKMDSCAAHPKR